MKDATQQPYKFKHNEPAKMLMFDNIPDAVIPLMDKNNMVIGRFSKDPFPCDPDAFLWHFVVDNSKVVFILGDEQPEETHGFYERIHKPCTEHQWEEQFTGSQLIHKICTRCGAEKFE